MVFSSNLFLFIFLPIVLLSYFVVPKSWRNVLLLVASILFYSWGEGVYAFLMLFSICINWIFGRLISGRRREKSGKLLLASAIVLNLTPLLYFKYSHFLLTSAGSLLSIDINGATSTPPHLPIGISFFTFQALSYLVDVYRDTSKAQKSLINIGLYISLFPQLIAGPIVRYHDIAKEILERKVTSALFSSGVTRFVFGLSKKMLLANPLAVMADTIFSLSPDNLSTPVAWVGILCYTLQIYYDFSGYSDMAIGLGRMFGFHFLENFNYPYIARSVREFWRRWHISLSNWFRDYLYIPLGGNRKGRWRTHFNLMTVFVLCGLWHGASWNFLLWGVSHGLFMLFERSSLGRLVDAAPRFVQHCYLLFFVVNTWVFFRVESFSDMLIYFSAMYGLHESSSYLTAILYILDGQFILTFCIALFLATPMAAKLGKRLADYAADGTAFILYRSVISTGHVLLLSALLFLSWLQLAASAYNPFIYFRF